MTPEEALNIALLTKKMSGLKIAHNFLRMESGPIVSTYFFSLAATVKISDVVNRAEDIAFALDVPSVIITRVRGEISIAVPNKSKTLVAFDRCLNDIFTNPTLAAQKLPVNLGVNVRGVTSAIDLTEAPHILIAGSTGGGKSVLLASIIGTLACVKSKQEMKLILVDTKMLDLTLFGDLPHVVDTVTDIPQFHATLTRLSAIVRQRTEKMKGIARNIDEYNSYQDEKDRLPYYVVVIDEYADIVDQDKELAGTDSTISDLPRVNTRIKSLVQISRAAGVHFIIATQRPSTKVITGDIKANLPTRIALRLPSRHDSATILTSSGAEKLLGKGDMLLQHNNSEETLRFHSAYVDLSNIANILNNCDSIRESYKILSLVASSS